jgi:hypothetical protein
MHGMFKKATKGESPSVAKAEPVAGRERLHFFNEELAKANAAVADLERRVATLENIGIDAVAAERELQLYIASDAGTEALLAHAEGKSLIAAAKSTAEAATPAKAALPLAQDALASARAEVVRLGEEKQAEIGRYMTLLADETARKYKEAFELVCQLHDQLTGFANGTSVYMGEVMMIVEELKVPRFNLPSLACTNEHDPFLRRRGSSFTVGEFTKVWTAVKERLEADVDADLGDLIGRA